jgi:hypothetical protein
MHGNGVDPNEFDGEPVTMIDVRAYILSCVEHLRNDGGPVPPSVARARAVAITKLQEAAMWLNVAVMGEPR